MNAPFICGLVLTALLVLVGHWFPWPRRLPRLAAYAYGTAAILAGVSVWLMWSKLSDILAGVWAFAIVGGVATSLAWLTDWLMNLRIRSKVTDGRK